jgi:NAD(P)-dependent dehydrogenase (short-subunit alcohol dehydrogenase family)
MARVAVVTGGTRGIGEAISVAFTVWSAPKVLARASRGARRSTTMTVSAPMSRATATALRPRPPAPCTTSDWPARKPALRRP